MWISRKRWQSVEAAVEAIFGTIKLLAEQNQEVLDIAKGSDEERRAAQAKHVETLERMVQMRREGFQPPTPVLETDDEDPLPVDVQAAVVAVAGEHGALNQKLIANAYARLKQDWAVEDIVKEVYAGLDVDELLDLP
jgi:hypothetical protein